MQPRPGADSGAETQPPVIVGKITGAHGVKGWVKVHSYTRPAEEILHYDPWLLAQQRDADAAHWQSARVASTRRQSQKLLAKLAGIDDRDASEGLAGHWVAIDSSQLARLPEGEYDWSDLIGLSVVNRDGVELGIVDHLIETGANDVLAVRGGAGSDAVERLLPWTAEVIVEVDVRGGRIRVDWEADF